MSSTAAQPRPRMSKRFVIGQFSSKLALVKRAGKRESRNAGEREHGLSARFLAFPPSRFPCELSASRQNHKDAVHSPASHFLIAVGFSLNMSDPGTM